MLTCCVSARVSTTLWRQRDWLVRWLRFFRPLITYARNLVSGELKSNSVGRDSIFIPRAAAPIACLLERKRDAICDGSREKSFVEFIVNVNSSAERRSPRFSQASVCEITSSSNCNSSEGNGSLSSSSSVQYLLALKTDRTVAILKLHNNYAVMLHQLEFSDRLVGKSSITYHSFVERILPETSATVTTASTTTIKDSPDILVGFSNGTILVMNALSKQFKYQFNTVNEKSEAPWHARNPTKIQYIPHKNTFLVLFIDSTFIEYSLNSLEENFEVQSDFTKLASTVSFIPKKLTPAVSKKLYTSFEFSSISDAPFVGYACFAKQLAGFSGPNIICKFKCPSISDFAVLPRSNPLYQRLQVSARTTTDLLAFTGLDGILRVVDINNFQPVYSFKTFYGGINSFFIDESNPTSPLISIACQDDSVVLLNTVTEAFWRIQGHTSFVTSTSIHFIHAETDSSEQPPVLIRVVAASLDGSVSITDFDREEVLDEATTTATTNHVINDSSCSIPVKMKLDVKKVRELPENRTHFQKVNEEGIAFQLGFRDYFLTSAFDGCLTVFRFLPLSSDPMIEKPIAESLEKIVPPAAAAQQMDKEEPYNDNIRSRESSGRVNDEEDSTHNFPRAKLHVRNPTMSNFTESDQSYSQRVRETQKDEVEERVQDKNRQINESNQHPNHQGFKENDDSSASQKRKSSKNSAVTNKNNTNNSSQQQLKNHNSSQPPLF